MKDTNKAESGVENKKKSHHANTKRRNEDGSYCVAIGDD